MLQDYIEQLGSIAEFMPEGLKTEYHFICIENLLLLEQHDTQTARYILKTGLLSRFEPFEQLNISTVLLNDYLDKLISELAESQQVLLDSTEKLRKQVKSEENTQSMDAFLRSLQAYRKIKAALDLPASQSLEQFQQAEQLLISSLEINNFDYLAHFQLGWLYLTILSDLEKAQHCFEIAGKKSLKQDMPFYLFARRHLALCMSMQKDYHTALVIVQDLYQFSAVSCALEYEQLRYALYKNEFDIVAQQMSILSNCHSLYFPLIQTEALFQRCTQLHSLPEQIRSNKIRTIQKKFDDRWKRCPLRLIQMDEGCNVNRVYYRTLKHYMPELDATEFMELESQGQQLGETIFQVTRANITSEIDKRYRQYDEEIIKKQQGYVWLHKSSKFVFSFALIIIAALFVLGFYLVMDRYFIPGDLGITVNTWLSTLSGMIFVLILGFIGTIFETRAVHKLFSKQKLVNDALNKLNKKPSSQ